MAWETLKKALKEGLQVFQLEPGQPFVLCTDTSDFAIGAVLKQERDGDWVPVSFSVGSFGRVNSTGHPEKRNPMPS